MNLSLDSMDISCVTKYFYFARNGWTARFHSTEHLIAYSSLCETFYNFLARSSTPIKMDECVGSNFYSYTEFQSRSFSLILAGKRQHKSWSMPCCTYWIAGYCIYRIMHEKMESWMFEVFLFTLLYWKIWAKHRAFIFFFLSYRLHSCWF